MNITIRKIEEKDNLSLAKMIREVFDEHNAPRTGTVYSDPTTDNLYTLFKTPKSILWVAEVENEVVGCCGVYPTEGLEEGYAELVKYYLSNKSRGLGIGRDLMQKSVDSAKEFGYMQLYLESFPQFAKAVGIYEKQGFVRIDHPLGSSGHTSCNIWMVKDL